MRAGQLAPAFDKFDIQPIVIKARKRSQPGVEIIDVGFVYLAKELWKKGRPDSMPSSALLLLVAENSFMLGSFKPLSCEGS